MQKDGKATINRRISIGRNSSIRNYSNSGMNEQASISIGAIRKEFTFLKKSVSFNNSLQAQILLPRMDDNTCNLNSYSLIQTCI
jgi:hypothetical protein